MFNNKKIARLEKEIERLKKENELLKSEPLKGTLPEYPRGSFCEDCAFKPHWFIPMICLNCRTPETVESLIDKSNSNE